MRNVLLVTVDSLRADHVGAYGYDRDVSPVVDDLASSGHRFTNAFSHAGATRASFPSILTSSYPLMYGGYDHLSEDRTIVSEVLDDAGYSTAGFHSNPFLSANFGYSRGFDTFYDSESEPSLLARARQYVVQNMNRESTLFQMMKRVFDTTEKRAGIEMGSAYVKADELTDRAVDWLRGPAQEPGFTWVHYMDVHHPYVPPAEYQELVAGEVVSDRKAIQLRRKMLEEPENVTEDERRTLVDLYDAETRFVDDEVGRLVEAARDVWEDPVILFTADHGEEFGEHGQFSHNTVRDEGVHVPLVIEDENGSGVYDDVVGLLDLAPTIVEYAGREIPDNYYGYPIQDLFDGDWPRESAIGNWGQIDDEPWWFFYRDREWKYIRRDEEQLFYLPDDPNEKDDVSETQIEQLERIRTEVDELERTIQNTQQKLGTVDMSEDVQERLEMLGYVDE